MTKTFDTIEDFSLFSNTSSLVLEEDSKIEKDKKTFHFSIKSSTPFIVTEEEVAPYAGLLFPIPDTIILTEEVKKYNLDEFIGMLSDEEAEQKIRDIKMFRKQFDDDFTSRNKILFGE